MQASNLSAIIPEIWDTEMLAARYAAAPILNRVLNKSSKMAGMGDIFHIPVEPRFSGGNVTQATGAFSTEEQTITDVTGTIDTWKQVSTEIPKSLQAQAMIDLFAKLPKSFGKKLAEYTDTSLGALLTVSNYTNTAVGSAVSPVQFTDDAILEAMLTLSVALKMNLAENKEDVSWMLNPHAFYKGLFTKDRFTDADKLGMPKSVLTSGLRYPIFGIPAYETLLLPENGSGATANNTCALLHREAMAAGLQINNEYEKVSLVPAGKLADLMVAHTWYGVTKVRGDHAVLIFVQQ